MLLVDDLAAGGTKNLRQTPRGLVTLRSETQGFNSLTVRGYFMKVVNGALWKGLQILYFGYSWCDAHARHGVKMVTLDRVKFY